MEKVELNKIETHLLDLKLNLEESLKYLFKDKTREEETLTADLDDQSIIIENDDVIDDLDKIKLAELKQVEHTLFRIDTGGYGICEECSEAISPKRLKALPYATKCIECSVDEQ
jgi:RNA polymerase-binding transcription factor DksA